MSRLSTRRLLIRGQRLVSRRRFDEALNSYAEVVRRMPDHISGLRGKFMCHYHLKQWPEAKEIGEKIVILQPSAEGVMVNYTAILVDEKDYNTAAWVLNLLIANTGGSAKAYFNLGFVERARGEFALAIECFRRALHFNPNMDSALQMLSDLFEQVGMQESQLETLNLLRILRHSHPQTLANYIEALAHSDQANETEIETELNIWREQFLPKASPSSDDSLNVTTALNSNELSIGFVIGDINFDLLTLTLLPTCLALYKEQHSVHLLATTQESLTKIQHVLSQDKTLQNNERIVIHDFSKPDERGFADAVTSMKLDLLVDVTGFKRGQRLRAINTCLAPRQIGWLSHIGSYGSDRITILESSALPAPICYQPNGSRPLQQSFKAKNNIDDQQKDDRLNIVGLSAEKGISDATSRCWASLLTQCRNAVLSIQLGNKHIRDQVAQMFINKGVAAEQLNLTLTKIDISQQHLALENLTRHSPNQVAQAIWNKVPVVTLHATPYTADVSTQILQSQQLACGVCDSEFSYVELAKSLLEETDIRADYDNKLDDVDDNGALFNPQLFAQKFIAAVTT